jgi:hypothetical protein
MPIISYDTWVEEDTYLDELAKLHKLGPKLDVIIVLKQEFDNLQSPQYKPELEAGEKKKWLCAELSAHIVALSLELTDDLAAVCWSYLQTIANGDKLFIQLLANWKLEQGHKFYAKVANDPKEAARAIGEDASTTAAQENTRQRFAWIKGMRDQFWSCYQGYKHAQRATPIVLTMSKDGTTTTQEWGLYHIPQTFKRKSENGKQMIHSEKRFINTVRDVGSFCNLASTCVDLADTTKVNQYPKVFNHPLT